jgi:hypothetical protein
MPRVHNFDRIPKVSSFDENPPLLPSFLQKGVSTRAYVYDFIHLHMLNILLDGWNRGNNWPHCLITATMWEGSHMSFIGTGLEAKQF